jgi:hypothetical protein
MKFNIQHIFLGLCMTLVAAVAATSCIENDVPYPHIQANILSIEAEGQSRSAAIDTINRIVTLYFNEEADLYNVNITNYAISADAEVVDDVFSQPIDLSRTRTVNLHYFYDWDWTITAVQNIERYFTVEGQIGSSTIDATGRRVIAYVNEAMDLANLKVETCKLGATGSIENPALEGRTVDFTRPVQVVVNTHDRREVWTIYIETTEAKVTTSRVDAWTNVAWVYGEAEAGADNTVQYRLKGESEWTTVPESWLTHDGGSFNARLVHLTAATTYEARAVSGEDVGATIEFTTGLATQIPNSGFDDWWLNGKVWNPWAENGEQWWDTGNKGATTLGSSNSQPTDDTRSGTGMAAMLETKFVGIGVVGKLAAGNVFIGSYVATDGTNGILSFGHSFTQRPTRVRGYLKYKTAPISSTATGFEDYKDRPDTCIVWCALIDTDEPFEIRTRPTNRQLFDPNGDYVVGYGKVEYGHDINNYTQFEFTIDYKSTSRVPKYVLLTASASKYGDYFVGGNGAVLYIDDVELLYDY